MPIKIPTSPFIVTQGKELKVGSQYVIQRDGHPPRIATILDTRLSKNENGLKEAYISFLGQDKRLDIWIKESQVGEEVNQLVTSEAGPSRLPALNDRSDHIIENEAGPSTISSNDKIKDKDGDLDQIKDRKKRSDKSPRPRSEASTPEREHAAMTRVRNFEDVRFGEYLIKTWYYSPYPLPLNDPSLSHVPSTPHRPEPQVSSISSSSSSNPSKKRRLDIGTTKHPDKEKEKEKDPTVIGIVTSHRPNLKHNRTVSEMFSGVGKGGEGARGRLWVCDLCFKYMRTRTGWDRHTSSCAMLQPPGRKVYQRGSYTIWEVDGAYSTLYCQNLSLFGKLFIDHKSVFFHVENFLFYVLCDAATSRRDQVMAFFSKEKLSYDDHNLACIVAFPPFQNRGFGKLLIEFSYYLTYHPSTRPLSLSPGTPERPLSDLGLKGYTACWISIVLRFFKDLLSNAEPFKLYESPRKMVKSPIKPIPPKSKESEGRVLRIRKPISSDDDKNTTLSRGKGEKVIINEIEIVKTPIVSHRGQYSITLNLMEIAKAVHLRIDDVSFTLSELGLLSHRRDMTRTSSSARNASGNVDGNRKENGNGAASGEEGKRDETEGEWKDIEIVISRDMIDDLWKKWNVRDKGVLEEEYVLL
ncbi:uncharacterized protein IL334_003713 [Kwoniella shivajii]|uniref:MYST-type HAT domain-containing protein n=1 Tax=Kwoniella shivajii TaxID=564305 RepID=A0ABZ1CYN0_9TREE|nr:hypothetical protein IL334_003713 [Kwoniella shivajii]